MIQAPVAVGLMVCQQAITEEKTRRVTLVNCLQHLEVENLPSSRQELTVCCLLTDGLGEMDLTLEILYLASDELIVTHTGRVVMNHPLRKQWYYGRLKGVVFPRQGRYQFSLLANREWVAQATLEVIPKGEKK
jgi:hypothetical protein